MSNKEKNRWPPNPFSAGAVLQPQWFTGRAAELSLVRKAGRDEWPLLTVRGPRGIGKTSLVEQAFLEDPSREERARYVYIDIRDYVDAGLVSNPRQAVRRVIQGVIEELDFELGVPAHVDVARATAQELFRSVLPKLSEEDAPRLVIALDELDYLDEACLDKLVNRLRGTRRQKRAPLWCFIVGETWGTQPGSALGRDETSVIRLGSLSVEEVAALLERYEAVGLFRFEPEAIAMVHEMTGGYPLFLAALLDDLYDRRWPERDVSPVTTRHIREAALEREGRPTDRIQHAFRQAGPAAQRVLYALAEEGRGGMSAAELHQRFERDWLMWATQAGPTLEKLKTFGLLDQSPSGIWTHRIPLLEGYVSRLGPDAVDDGNRPPRADAWAVFRKGEDLERDGNLDAAVEQYQHAEALDGEYWAPRWSRARLLFERALRRDAGREQDLLDAEDLLQRLVRESMPNQQLRIDVRTLLCRVLVAWAQLMQPGQSRRRQRLGQVKELDPQLRTPGAALLLAEDLAKEFFDGLTSFGEQFWPGETRKTLRRGAHVGVALVWQQLATNLVKHLADSTPGRGRKLMSGVAPELLVEQLPDVDTTPLWIAIDTWFHAHGRVLTPDQDGPMLSTKGWEVLLLDAPAGLAAKILEASSQWLESDVVRQLESTDSREGERLVQLVVAPELNEAVGAKAWEQLKKRVWTRLENLDKLAVHHTHVAGALGPALLVFRQAEAVELDVLKLFLALYCDRWQSEPAQLRIPVTTRAERAWRELLGILPQETTAPLLARLAHVGVAQTEVELDEEAKEELLSRLDGSYRIVRKVPIELPGLASAVLDEVLTGFEVMAQPQKKSPNSAEEERLLIRRLHLRGPNQETARLLRTIWAHERRVLAALSLTPEGRALPTLRWARMINEADVALLCTSWFGEKRLRDLIADSGAQGTSQLKAPNPVRACVGSAAFWSHMRALVEAVDSLHRSLHIHRSISPDTIYIREGFTEDWSRAEPRVNPVLQLGHFEWSVYLRGLFGLQPVRLRRLNRYTAPEALRSILNVPRQPNGESFRSDLYSLGLTLYECLLGAIPSAELGEYRTAADYDEDEELRHRDWLKGLQQEILTAAQSGALHPLERDLLHMLLHFDLERRPSGLHDVLKLIARLATQDLTSLVQGRLTVFTTLTERRSDGELRSPLDPREDPNNIAFYLKRLLSEVAIARVDGNVNDLGPAKLAEIVSRDLQRAEVLVNRNLSIAPLLLRSRTGVLYRVKPFVWTDQEGRVEPELEPLFAKLEVARPLDGDGPLGDPIVVLENGVSVRNIKREVVYEAKRDSSSSDASWEPLFGIVSQAEDDYKQLVEQHSERTLLTNVLEYSVEAEYELAWLEHEFVRVQPGTSLVQSPTGPEGADNLADLVSALITDDSFVEIARKHDPMGSGVEVALDPTCLDSESGVVELPMEPADLPETGVIRASGNIGTAALYRRRRRVLRQLHGDTHLLDVIVDPAAYSHVSPGMGEGGNEAFCLIDEDKTEIARRFEETRPLILVQGPPGTGKTTLATELLLRTLGETPDARILVTTQGHEPLDNLLERLIAEKRRNTEAERVLEECEIVRIPSGRRQQWPADVAPYLPAPRAERLFFEMQRWKDRGRGALGLVGLTAAALDAALKAYATAPLCLRRRIEEGANLVLVTTNAREIEISMPASFDLAVIEEAARSVPVEILGAMRLTRRWLLIGDHQQLPPYGFDQVAREVGGRIGEEREKKDQEVEAEVARGKPNPQRLQLLEEERARLLRLQSIAPQYLQVFKHLHDQHPLEEQARHNLTLQTQWRMHPDLGSMVSQVFYDGRAVCNPREPGEEEALANRCTHAFRLPEQIMGKSLIWIDFDPADEEPLCAERRGPGGQLDNIAERRTAVAFLRELRAPRQVPDIAILTPYRRQAEQLRRLFGGGLNWFDAFGEIADRIYTVDSFQGRQAGTVLLSLVRNNSFPAERTAVGFLARRQRGTVMFSRAEKLLVVLGCSTHFKKHPSTSWIAQVHERAHHIHWRDVLPADEVIKIEQQRNKWR